MTKFEQIKQEVADFQGKADNYIKKYNEQMLRARRRYSPEVFSEKSMQIWAENSGELNAERDIAIKNIELIVEEIKTDFQKWMCKPIDANLLATLNCIRNFEIKLSKDEINVLRDAVNDSFFGSKIISEIAKESGYYIKAPNMAAFMSMLHRAESLAKVAISAYCGSVPDCPGKDLLGEWRTNGIVLNGGEYPVWQRVSAAEYLAKDKSLKDVENLWAASKVPSDIELTEKEKERISGLMKGADTDEEKAERIKTIIEAEPDIINKMELEGSMYRNAILRFVDTGSFEAEPPTHQ